MSLIEQAFGPDVASYACFNSPPISRACRDILAMRTRYIHETIEQRDAYLSQPNVDLDVFGTYWFRGDFDVPFVATIAEQIGEGRPGIFDRLRLLYIFTGYPISQYRQPETFPVIDPVYERYLKLRCLTPRQYRFGAPCVAGEAGWRGPEGLVNVDVAIVQERLQYLYFAGIFDWLAAQPRQRGKPSVGSVLEIGAGGGLFALAFNRAVSRVRYFICDLPEVLAIAFAYLNLTLPDRRHYVARPDGVSDLGTFGDRSRQVTISNLLDDDSWDGILYVPNYLLHDYDRLFHFDLILNAMSLPELRAAQISYYAGFIERGLERRRGAYVDFNSHAGTGNPIIDPALNRHLRHCHRMPWPDLGNVARIWSNDPGTIDVIRRSACEHETRHDLHAAFKLDKPFQFPRADKALLCELMNHDIGDFVGVDFGAWMSEHGYEFADHLMLYRERNSD